MSSSLEEARAFARGTRHRVGGALRGGEILGMANLSPSGEAWCGARLGSVTDEVLPGGERALCLDRHGRLVSAWAGTEAVYASPRRVDLLDLGEVEAYLRTTDVVLRRHLRLASDGSEGFIRLADVSLMLRLVLRS